jgi:pseudouridine kinase
MSDRGPNLLAIGGAHVDRLARLKAPHLAQTSNPADVTESIGGGAFNASRAAKRFGTHISMLSARGGDAGGALVDEAFALAEIEDLSSVHLDRATPSYTAILQPNGELVTAIADMALYETAIARSFKRAPVQKAAVMADAILCDANLSEAGVAGVFTEVAKGKPVYVIAISANKVLRLKKFLPQLSCMFMNRFEAAALTGLHEGTTSGDFAEALNEMGLKRAVITAGSTPAMFLDQETMTLISPPETKIVDVTGAGDCLAGTMVAALLNGARFMDAAKLGLAAASITASRQGAYPQISQQEIETLAATHDWNFT